MRRLAIVTSVDRRSAIARATIEMATHLAELADVIIFAEPTTQPLPCPLPLRTINDDLIGRQDHSIVVLGDSPFHVQGFWIARRRPSIVILHDVVMAHLASAAMSLDDLSADVVRFYGAERGAAVMDNAATLKPFWDGPNALDAPLFESVTQAATGVVVHSEFAAQRVRQRVAAPVTVLPLAYSAPWSLSNSVSDRAPERMLLTLGYANPNKSHELVIEALAEMGDSTVRYVVAGSVADDRARHLSRLADALGVAEQVEILGHVGTAEAAELLGRAAVCVNLRAPALEGGSASLVEQMAAGKPVVVFDHGCYADPPDDTLVKMPISTTPVSLAATLRGLLDDPGRCWELGERARAHVRTQHSFGHYAAGLSAFFDEVESAAPIGRLIRRVAATSQTWHMGHETSLARRWAHMITTMTAEPTRSLD